MAVPELIGGDAIEGSGLQPGRVSLAVVERLHYARRQKLPRLVLLAVWRPTAPEFHPGLLEDPCQHAKGPRDDNASPKDELEDLGSIPTGPVDTDDNDEPYADASGDSGDERPDENQALPDTAGT